MSVETRDIFSRLYSWTGDEFECNLKNTPINEIAVLYYYLVNSCKKLKGEKVVEEFEYVSKILLKDFFEKQADLRKKFGITIEELEKNSEYESQKKHLKEQKLKEQKQKAPVIPSQRRQVFDDRI